MGCYISCGDKPSPEPTFEMVLMMLGFVCVCVCVFYRLKSSQGSSQYDLHVRFMTKTLKDITFFCFSLVVHIYSYHM